MMFVKGKDEALLKSIVDVMKESAQETEEQRKKAAEYLEKTAYAGMRLEEGYGEMTQKAPLRMKVAAAAKMKEQEAKKTQQSTKDMKKEEVDLDFNDLLEYMLTPEFDQLDEISKETLKSYIPKAARSLGAAHDRETYGKAGYGVLSQVDTKTISKRTKGLTNAVKKMTKEEFDQLDEISKGTLGSYIKKATSSSDERSISNLSSRAADKLNNPVGDDSGEKDDHKSYLRSKGIARAVSRLTKEEVEIEESIEDRLEAAREKAAVKGKIKEKEPEAKPAVRKVAGKAYGGSKQKEKEEMDESADLEEAKKNPYSDSHTAPHHDPTMGDATRVSAEHASTPANNKFHAALTKAGYSLVEPKGLKSEVVKKDSAITYKHKNGAEARVHFKGPKGHATHVVHETGKLHNANMVGSQWRASTTHDDAGSLKKALEESTDLGEATIHPMGVHVIRHPGGKMQVHAVGKNVEGIEVGEHLHDSELDDLADMGHKIKEVKPPKKVAEAYEVEFNDGTTQIIDADIVEHVETVVAKLSEEVQSKVVEYMNQSHDNFMAVHKMVS